LQGPVPAVELVAQDAVNAFFTAPVESGQCEYRCRAASAGDWTVSADGLETEPAERLAPERGSRDVCTWNLRRHIATGDAGAPPVVMMRSIAGSSIQSSATPPARYVVTVLARGRCGSRRR
jgi:hypothetical protein